MREKRIDISDEHLDKLEMDWWNLNAATIEKIWALNLEFQNIVRLPYLKKMKKFFTSHAPKLPIKILEIGCGSGWVCRLIADEKFHVIGTDFSVGQLAIAQSQAKIYGKERYCHYMLADASSFPKDIDGIVIHALLHHLSVTELEIFFHQLAKIPSHTKVFMYEPLFIRPKGRIPTLKDKILNKMLMKIRNFSIKRAKAKGSPDKDLEHALDTIYDDARVNGWYISPKEVPFYEDELNDYISPIFIVKKKYIVNKTDLDIAQSLVMNKIFKPDFFFSKILIPFSTWLDKLFVKGNFTFYVNPKTHHFVCFELVRK